MIINSYLFYFDRSKIVLGDGQIPGQIQRQRQIEVNGNAATVCCAMSFPAEWPFGGFWKSVVDGNTFFFSHRQIWKLLQEVSVSSKQRMIKQIDEETTNYDRLKKM